LYLCRLRISPQNELSIMKVIIRTLVVFVLLVGSFASHAQSAAQKPKRIYITLDVSGSMEGNKYLMANYAAQSIAVFSNAEDRVYVYYLGSKHDISSAEGYKNLQIEYNNLKGKNAYYEISDVSQFLKDYKANVQYQDWLFIIGDGAWNYGVKAKAEFGVATPQLAQLIEDNDLQVCYLQTGNVDTVKYDFTTFLESLNSPTVDIRYSDTTASSVLGNCVYFTNRILGFSHTNVKLYQQDDQNVSFCSEFPLERCLLVYQTSQTVADETKIVKTTCNETKLSVVVKGNPSTKKLVSKGKPFLNGMVWELSSPQTIPANDTVKVQFNQKVDVKDLKLYPYVDVAILLRPWSVTKDTLVEASPNRYYICEKEDEALIRLMATDKFARKFPPPLMQKMDVKMVVGNDTLTMKYDNADTSFFAVASMPDQELSYFAYVESPGYFSRISDKQYLEKNIEVCPPECVPLITLPPQYFDPVTFEELKKGVSFGGEVDDTVFRQVATIGVFDNQTVKDLNNYPFAEKLTYSQDSFALSFVQRPNSGWCECAFPDSLYYEVTLVSSKGIVVDDKSYEGFVIPIWIPVDKRCWVVRCKNYLILGIALLLNIAYLVAIKKKKRFKKNAGIASTYMELRGSRPRETSNGKPRKLRKKGFGSWFKRWFVPFVDESRRMEWKVPPAGSIVFVANKSKEKVDIKKSSFNPVKMKMGDFDLAEAGKVKTIEMTDPIKVYSVKKYEGSLTYEPGGKDDEKKFIMFVVIFITISAMALGAVLFVLIKSLL